MARRRFFVDSVRNGQAEIEGDSAHHLTRVLRVEAGQKYEISDTNRAWLAEVELARKNLVRFTILEEIEDGPALPECTVYLSLIKFERLEWAVEKATELGATRIVPMEATRSDHGLFEGARKRVERWRRIAREASEQIRRLRPPEVADPIRFKSLPPNGFWLDEQPGAPPLADVARGIGSGAVSLIFGPEGGWADPERAQLQASGWKGATLGPHVVRAETAVCAALGVIAQCRIQSNHPDAG